MSTPTPVVEVFLKKIAYLLFFFIFRKNNYESIFKHLLFYNFFFALLIIIRLLKLSFIINSFIIDFFFKQ